MVFPHANDGRMFVRGLEPFGELYMGDSGGDSGSDPVEPWVRLNADEEEEAPAAVPAPAAEAAPGPPPPLLPNIDAAPPPPPPPPDTFMSSIMRLACSSTSEDRTHRTAPNGRTEKNTARQRAVGQQIGKTPVWIPLPLYCTMTGELAHPVVTTHRRNVLCEPATQLSLTGEGKDGGIDALRDHLRLPLPNARLLWINRSIDRSKAGEGREVGQSRGGWVNRVAEPKQPLYLLLAEDRG